MRERTATLSRQTGETQVELSLSLDGSGAADIEVPVPFFGHMLESLAKHSKVDLKVAARGDVEVDPHHLVEDVGICLGQALDQALGDKKGIERFGEATVPLDESLVTSVVDLSGRSFLSMDLGELSGTVGGFDVELTRDFFQALTANARMNLHLRVQVGGNKHHVIEAAFKSFARALLKAIARCGAADEVPSTKGTL